MISHIHSQGKNGCDDAALKRCLISGNEIKKRLTAMEQDQWIKLSEQNWLLTIKGQRIARFFEYYAKIIGLRPGG
jgi:hypothetical protein